MAAQSIRAGACFVPFYRYSPSGNSVRSHWAPRRTGQMWEDWALGKAYAHHYVSLLKEDQLSEVSLVHIVGQMAPFLDQDRWVEVGFIDALSKEIKRPR